MNITHEQEGISETLLNLKFLVAMTMADVDIFLLQNKEQTADNDQELFTREEIRDQLKKTMENVCNGLSKCGYSLEKPLKVDDVFKRLDKITDFL